MSYIRYIIVGLVIAAALFIGGLFTGLSCGSSDDKPPIERKEVTETKWKAEYLSLKEKFDNYKKSQKKVSVKKEVKEDLKKQFTFEDFEYTANCAFSSINFKEKYSTKYSFLVFRTNYLDVTAYDDCKQATAKYEIGTTGNWRVYVTVGVVGVAAGIVTYKYLIK